MNLLSSDRALRCKLLVDLGYSEIDAGQFDSAKKAFDEALDAVSRAGDDAAAARARVGQLKHASMRPASDQQILDELRREIGTLESALDDWGLAEAWAFAGELETYLGRTRTAVELWERATACARASGHHRVQLRVASMQVTQEAFGHLAANDGLRKCDPLLAEVEGTVLEPFVLSARAIYRTWQGDFAGARQDIQRGRPLFREFGNHLMADSSAMIEAQVELEASDPVAAETVARQGYEALRQLGEQGFRSTVGCFLAEALYRQGSDDEAYRIASEAAAMTSIDDFVTHARSLATCSLVLAHRGDLEQAERLAREAVSHTGETDSFAEHAHSLVALADVLEFAGRREEAAEALRQAQANYERKAAVAPAHAIRERLAVLNEAPI